MSAALASWLLTFLVDSTLLLGVAWLLGATALRRAPRRREFVWRMAIVVSLAAPGFQMAAGRSVPVEPILQRAAPIRPLPSSVEISGDGAAREGLAERRAATDVLADGTPSDRPPSTGHDRRLGGGEAVDTPRASGPGVVGGGGGSVIPYFLRLWMSIALAGLALAAWRHSRFLRALGTRRPVPPSPTRTAFETLRRGRATLGGVRLTGSTTLPVPATLSGREICVPWPRFANLEPGRRRALLAHELAHVERRDPLWRWAVQILVAVFFFQPLLRTARRELRATSERLADERAVRRTGAPDVVAAALGEVAEWIGSAHLAHVAHVARAARTVGAVDGESDLVDRVRAILGRPAGAAMTWSRRQRGGMGTVTLAVTVLAVPAIAAVGAESDGPPVLPEAQAGPDTARTPDVDGPAAPAGERPSAPVVDRTAARVVENVAPRLPAGSWTVTGEALMTCSATGSTGDPRIEEVVDLVPLGPDEVGVLALESRALLLCEDGRVTSSFGGPGEGPGRFRGVREAMRGPGDSLVVFSPWKAVLFDRSGRGFREIRREEAGSDDHLSLLLETTAGLAGSRFTDGVIRPEGEGLVDIQYLGWDGRPHARVGPVPWTTSLETVTAVALWPVEPAYAIDRDGYWFASRDTFEIRHYTARGLETVIVAPSSPVPITDEHRALAERRMTEWGWGYERVHGFLGRDADRPEGTRAPAILALLLDDAGRIWAAVPEARPGSDPRRWRVFGADGGWVTDVELPPGFQLLAVRGDRLYGVTRDSASGPETVEILELSR